MSLVKFHDSNFIDGYNKPDIVATADTYNGQVFDVVYDTTNEVDEATFYADAASAQAGDPYFMMNIIDKPEVLNTEDYKVVAGEFIRGFRCKDFVGLDVDMSADLIKDDWDSLANGFALVPCDTATDTAANNGKWKYLADPSAYPVYLYIKKKNTFGTFTVDAGGGAVKGGVQAEIRVN